MGVFGSLPFGYARVGESYNESGGTGTSPTASLTFIGPSKYRYHFLQVVFGTAQLDEPLWIEGNGFQEACLFDPEFPELGTRFDYQQLWPSNYSISEVGNSAPAYMAAIDDCVESGYGCPVLIQVTYARREVGADIPGPTPGGLIALSVPQISVLTLPDGHRAYCYAIVQPGEDPKLKSDSGARQKVLQGSWVINWKITNPDIQGMLNVAGCTNSAPFFGFPSESLIFMAPQVRERLVSPQFAFYDINMPFTISMKSEVGFDGSPEALPAKELLLGIVNRTLSERGEDAPLDNPEGSYSCHTNFRAVKVCEGGQLPCPLIDFSNELFLTVVPPP